jgi:hypothetical protein
MNIFKLFFECYDFIVEHRLSSTKALLLVAHQWFCVQAFHLFCIIP